MKKYLYIILLFTSIVNKDVLSQGENGTINNILIRPNVNIGFLEEETAYSFGGRVLLPAGGNKAYGIEFSYFNTNKTNNEFFSAGIVLEQKLFNWLNMSIGSIGYFNYGVNSNNLVGITTNLGWEPNTKKMISPFITYRSDLIFSKKVNSFNGLNIGVNIRL